MRIEHEVRLRRSTNHLTMPYAFRHVSSDVSDPSRMSPIRSAAFAFRKQAWFAGIGSLPSIGKLA